MSTDTTPVDSHERQHLADKASVESAVSSTPHLLRRMGGLARPYRKGMVQGGLLVVLYAFTTLAGPYLVSVGIDQGIAKHDGHTLNLVVAAFVAVALLAWVVERAQILVISKVGEAFLRDLRTQVFDHLQRLSMPFYDREKAGVIVSRMTADIDSMEDLVQQGLLLMLSNTVLLVVAVVFLAVVSWQLLLICLIPVPLVIVATVKFQRDSNRSYLRIRDWIGLTLTSLQEGISGVRVIQAFSREDTQVKRFSRRNRGLYDEYMRSVWISCWYLPIIEFSGTFTTGLVIGVGGYMTLHGVVTVGTVSFFVLSLSNLFDPIQQLSQYFNQVQSSSAGLSKLFALLDTPVDVAEADDPVDLPKQGAIEVHGVSFSYGGSDELVLRDVDLTVAPGERLALVGPTGAGKSTLAKLIARLYDPVSGTVSFGGVDLRQASHASLRRHLCVVPQEGFLFSGTILENVRLARPEATDAEVRCGARRHRVAGALRGAARGPGHRGPRARVAPVCRREAARVAGPGRARRPRGAGARRGHLLARPRHRGRRRERHGEAHAGAHGHRHRAPAVDLRAGRPRRCGRRRSPRRAGPARRARRAGRPLRRPLRQLDARPLPLRQLTHPTARPTLVLGGPTPPGGRRKPPKRGGGGGWGGYLVRAAFVVGGWVGGGVVGGGSVRCRSASNSGSICRAIRVAPARVKCTPSPSRTCSWPPPGFGR